MIILFMIFYRAVMCTVRTVIRVAVALISIVHNFIHFEHMMYIAGAEKMCLYDKPAAQKRNSTDKCNNWCKSFFRHHKNGTAAIT